MGKGRARTDTGPICREQFNTGQVVGIESPH